MFLVLCTRPRALSNCFQAVKLKFSMMKEAWTCVDDDGNYMDQLS